MSRDRYFQILSMLHLCNNNDQVRGDRLFKLKMVTNEVQKNFRDAMLPFSDIVIDESLVLWKGRLSFKQFIKTKRHRFGIKLFVLCNVETDFILGFIIYTGSSTELVPCNKNLGVSGAVVKTLIKPYLNKGHNLYTDNWYNSSILSKYLLKNKTNSCGTVGKNRRGMPELQNKLKIGETQSKNTKYIQALKWMDRREVFMLNTIFPNTFTETEKTDEHGNLKKKTNFYC